MIVLHQSTYMHCGHGKFARMSILARAHDDKRVEWQCGGARSGMQEEMYRKERVVTEAE
jgi:hypothetical protein